MATKKRIDPFQTALVTSIIVISVIMVAFLSVEISNNYQSTASVRPVVYKNYQPALVLPLPPAPPPLPPGF